MSDPSYNTKVHRDQGGDRLTVESAGTIAVLSGGSANIAGVLNIDTGGSITGAGGINVTSAVVGTLTLGGTVGRWAFGSATLASGTALVYTGLGQIIAANASYLAPLSAGTGAGSATSFQVNPTRFANGTAYFLGLTGTSAFTGAGTVTWYAFGV